MEGLLAGIKNLKHKGRTVTSVDIVEFHVVRAEEVIADLVRIFLGRFCACHGHLSHECEVVWLFAEIGKDSKSLVEVSQHFGIVGGTDEARAARSDRSACPFSIGTTAVGAHLLDDEVLRTFVGNLEGCSFRCMPQEGTHFLGGLVK